MNATAIRTAVLPAKELSRAITAALRVIHRKNTIPILGCARLTIKNGRASVTGTDMDAEVISAFDAADAPAVLMPMRV